MTKQCLVWANELLVSGQHLRVELFHAVMHAAVCCVVLML